LRRWLRRNIQRIVELMEKSLMLVTALKPDIGTTMLRRLPKWH